MMLSLLAQVPAEAPLGMWESPFMQGLGIWVAVGFTLALYTFLYKDNPVFKFAEHVYVGVTNGYLLWSAWFSSVKNDLVYPMGRLFGHVFRPSTIALKPDDSWWLLVPASLSLFMILRFHPKTVWLSRWSFAFIVGTTAGVLIPLTVQAQIFQQMGTMMKSPIIFEGKSFSLMGTVSALLLLVGVIAVLVYFVFSVEHKGPVKHVARTGVIFLMIAFGAHFGYTVMGRESLLIERLQFLKDSAGNSAPEGQPNPHRATLVLLPLVIGLVAAFELKRGMRRPEGEPPAGEPPPAAKA